MGRVISSVREEVTGRVNAHGQRVKTFLACGVPNLVTEHAIFEAALLGEECGADCGLFVGLEFIGDLYLSRLMRGRGRCDVWRRNIQSEERQRICPRQLRLGNGASQQT